ncbi:hypothetical protein M434DRAFT_398125 [Hypoxylon sp. CO27-5]|nr:hypothetical protein M434DRAFT_398125 [Hypoxylon sp. CO27-5]
MRIGCLQFAPQLGDIDNNLNRADAVLSKANPEDLDLLVVPELAFTGYNFKSLQQISPYLEPQGSGISALWARTTALKYNCVTLVGYPEQADIKTKWPTSPEYYNSVIIINGEGETIGNYRKSFLYYTDETWALEGQDGFWEGFIPGLGHTSLGVCMDLNPYKFEAPWHAFEFAFHVLEMESNLVIVTMAWLTREDGRMFSRMPNDPDLDTLSYWISRLEPIIRSDNDEEIIVVFCNRTGIEGDAVYAGTSTVIGIKNGEVSVYGMLGRGSKELLVVDTDVAPYAKLVYRPDKEESGVTFPHEDSNESFATLSTKSGGKERSEKPTKSLSSGGSETKNKPTNSSPKTPPKNITSSEASRHMAQPISPLSETALASHRSISSGGATKDYDYVPLGRRSRAGSDRSTGSVQGSISSRHSSNSKTSKDSKKSKSSSRTRASKGSVGSKGSSSRRSSSRKVRVVSPPLQTTNPKPASDTIPTPTGPSPTPLAIRPKLVIPKDAHKRPHIPTPHPAAAQKGQVRIYGGHVSIQQENTLPTPSTAFDDISPMSPNRFFWIPSDSLLRTPMDPRIWTPALADSPTLEMRTATPSQAYIRNIATVKTQPTMPRATEKPLPRSPRPSVETKHSVEATPSRVDESQPAARDDRTPIRPPSPKSRNASRSRNHERSDSAVGQRPDLAAIAQRLEALTPRPDSAAAQRVDTFSPRPESAAAQRNDTQKKGQGDMPDRPSSPKSRNASRTRSAAPEDLSDQRQSNGSKASILIGASPSILDSPRMRGPSAIFRPESPMSNVEPMYRPMSREAHSRSNSLALAYKVQTQEIPGVAGNRSQSRAASRGRQRIPKDATGAPNEPDTENVNGRDTSIPARRPSAPSIGFRNPAEYEAEIKRLSPESVQANSRAVSYDDEIVEEIIVRRSPSCAIHGKRRSKIESPGRGSASARASPESQASSKPDSSAESSSQPSKDKLKQSLVTSTSAEGTHVSAKGGST